MTAELESHDIHSRSREGEVGEEIFDLLQSFTDFLMFKQMFLDYKAVSGHTPLLRITALAFASPCTPQEKEGRSLDLGGLVVSSLNCKR